MNSLKIIIENNKTMTSQSYNADYLNLWWWIYFDESENNENIIAAIMNFNWNKRKRLKDVDITITHHNEFKELIIIVKKLIDYCERTMNARDKIYKIDFNSQISLKVIYIILLMHDQKKLQRV